MPGRRRPPSLAEIAATLRGIPERPLDVDWLGLDEADEVAVFLGDDRSPLPADIDLRAITDALECAVAEAPAEAAYRTHARVVCEPVFDLPKASTADSFHEPPAEGYAHLVFTNTALGPSADSVLTRRAEAFVVEDLGAAEHAALHARSHCAGCRVLGGGWRNAVTLASSGLYVFAFSPEPAREWIRIASPSVPRKWSANPLGRAQAIAFSLRFDGAIVLRP
jgi:hypothetical protein